MAGFKNTILGGAETLIRSAIKSFNYIAGVAGWRIAKDGSAELNSATIRGTLIVGGGITLDSTGIHVVGATRRWDIDNVAGVLSSRIPNDGTQAQMYDAGYFLYPRNPTPILGASVTSPGKLFADDIAMSGGDEAPYVQLVSPIVNSQPTQSNLFLRGTSVNSLVNNSLAQLNAASIELNGDTHVTGDFAINRPRWVADFGTQNIPIASVAPLTPTSVSVNTGNMGVGGTVTIPSIDVWDIGCVFRFPSNTTGNRMARILLNGAELQSDVRVGVTGSFNTTVEITIKLLLNIGDQIQFVAYQNTTGVLALAGNGNRAWVMKELA
jgi:hypothetical protein